MRRLTALPILTLIALLLVGADTGVHANKVEEYDFMGLYKAFARACIRGDLGTYRKLRASNELQRIEGLYARRDMTLTGRDIKPKRDHLLTRFEEFPVIQKNLSPDLVRLVLWNDIDVEGRQYELVCIMFHMEDGMWKIGLFGSVMLDRNKLQRNGSFPEEELPDVYRLDKTP